MKDYSKEVLVQYLINDDAYFHELLEHWYKLYFNLSIERK